MTEEQLNKYLIQFEHKLRTDLENTYFLVVNNKAERLRILNNVLTQYKYSGEIENYKIEFKETDSTATCQVQLSKSIYSIFNFYVCMERNLYERFEEI